MRHNRPGSIILKSNCNARWPTRVPAFSMRPLKWNGKSTLHHLIMWSKLHCKIHLKSVGSSTKNSVRLRCLASSGRIISNPLTIVKLSILSMKCSDDSVCCPMHFITFGFGLRMHWLYTSLFALIKINLEIHKNNTISDMGNIFFLFRILRNFFNDINFTKHLKHRMICLAEVSFDTYQRFFHLISVSLIQKSYEFTRSTHFSVCLKIKSIHKTTKENWFIGKTRGDPFLNTKFSTLNENLSLFKIKMKLFGRCTRNFSNEWKLKAVCIG